MMDTIFSIQGMRVVSKFFLVNSGKSIVKFFINLKLCFINLPKSNLDKYIISWIICSKDSKNMQKEFILNLLSNKKGRWQAISPLFWFSLPKVLSLDFSPSM